MRSPDTGQGPWQELIPHRSVDVVQERDVRLAAPQRAHPRHTVPHLDQGVVRTHAPDPLAAHGPREDRVSAAAAHHVVAVAICGRGLPDRSRRAMGDLQSGGSPATHELVGVHFGAPGVGVVEIAPREHMHPSHPGRHHLVGKLLQTRHHDVIQGAGVSRPGRVGDAELRTRTEGSPVPTRCAAGSADPGRWHRQPSQESSRTERPSTPSSSW